MKIILSPRAEKQLKKLSKIDQIALISKIRKIRDESENIRPEKLKGFPHIFRIRVGNYRFAYRKTKKEIYIILIHHRRDVYKALKRLFL